MSGEIFFLTKKIVFGIVCEISNKVGELMADKICIKKKCFSPDVIKRLSLYLRNLRKIRKENITVISSAKIIEFLNVSAEQFRKDLSYFGGFGKRGVGYEVEKLIKEIETILGINEKWPIALIGAGKLGSALLKFEGFSKFNIRITCAFDIAQGKIGKTINGIKIEDINFLGKIIKEKQIRIAIITAPPEKAQGIVDELVRLKIRGILNFAPVILKIPDGIFISNVDMACELESLLFFVKHKAQRRVDSASSAE